MRSCATGDTVYQRDATFWWSAPKATANVADERRTEHRLWLRQTRQSSIRGRHPSEQNLHFYDTPTP